MVVLTPVRTLIGAAFLGTLAAPSAAVEVPPDYAVLPAAAPDAAADPGALNDRVRRAWSASGLGSQKSLTVDAWGDGAGLDLARPRA